MQTQPSIKFLNPWKLKHEIICVSTLIQSWGFDSLSVSETSFLTFLAVAVILASSASVQLTAFLNEQPVEKKNIKKN